MQERRTTRKHGPQAGIALLISIFILLLISVVAIALIVSSGTETSLAGNYRSSTGVYYAALSGLEEARGRLLAKNSGSFTSTEPGFIFSPLPMGQPVYIINQVGSEIVTPWDPASTYADLEFNQEFQPGYSLPNPSPHRNSLSTVAGVPGPLYKWVRINAVSETAIGVDVDGDGLDNTPLYYDSNLLKLVATGSGGAQQVFEITSFAILPNGSQKMLQYLVALAPPNAPSFPSGFSFPAALTIAGPSSGGVVFTPPTANSSYWVSGVDLTTVPSCAAGSNVDAIGVFSGTDAANVKGSIPATTNTKYDGLTAGPDVKDISGLFPGLQTPSQLDSLVQSIAANADVSIAPAGGTAYGSDLTPWLLSGTNPSGMSSTNPLTLVVKGDLDLTGWHNTGYGLLLVTGNLNYDPDASWKGMVLVIGKGTVTGSRAGTGEIDGAFFVAKTRDASGNLLPDPNLGNASIIFDPNMGSVGIRYSSCWIKAAQQSSGSLRILSFHEIAQP